MFNLICFLHAITYILISDSNDTPLRSKTPFETLQDKLLYYSLAEYISKYRLTNEFYTTINIISKYIRRKEADKPSIKEIKLLLITHITVIFQINIMRLEIFDLAKDFDDELVYHLTIISESTLSEIRLYSLLTFFEYNDCQYVLNRSMSFVAQAFMTLIYEMMLLEAKQGDWHWQKYSFFQNFVSELNLKDGTNNRFDTQNQAGIIDVDFPLSTIFTHEFNETDIVNELRKNKKNSVCLVSVYTELNVLKILENYIKDKKPEFTLQGANHRELFTILLQNSNFKLLRQIRQQVTDENYIAREVILFLKPGYYDYFFNERDQVCENYNLEAWKADTYVFAERMRNLKKIVNRFYFIDDGDDIKAVLLLGVSTIGLMYLIFCLLM